MMSVHTQSTLSLLAILMAWAMGATLCVPFLRGGSGAQEPDADASGEKAKRIGPSFLTRPIPMWHEPHNVAPNTVCDAQTHEVARISVFGRAMESTNFPTTCLAPASPSKHAD